MAFSGEDINLVRQKALIESHGAGSQYALQALFEFLSVLKNPDLQFVTFSGLDAADGVICAGACKLYALFGKKPAASTVDAWLKGSNHATVAAAAGDLATPFVGTGGGGLEFAQVFPDGLPLATGLTLGCHTTVNGNTKSATADAVTGFAIIGAA